MTRARTHPHKSDVCRVHRPSPAHHGGRIVVRGNGIRAGGADGTDRAGDPAEAEDAGSIAVEIVAVFTSVPVAAAEIGQVAV